MPALTPTPGSRSLTLDTTDLKKIAMGALIAVGSAVLTYAVDSVLPDLQARGAIDATLFVFFSTTINALRKFLSDSTISNK